MEITECPTALERDLNPPNTSLCPLLPLSLSVRPLYFSFSRKFAPLLVLIVCMPGIVYTVCLEVNTARSGLQLQVCMGGFSHLGGISGFYRSVSIPTGNLAVGLKRVCREQPSCAAPVRPFSHSGYLQGKLPISYASSKMLWGVHATTA